MSEDDWALLKIQPTEQKIKMDKGADKRTNCYKLIQSFVRYTCSCNYIHIFNQVQKATWGSQRDMTAKPCLYTLHQSLLLSTYLDTANSKLFKSFSGLNKLQGLLVHLHWLHLLHVFVTLCPLICILLCLFHTRYNLHVLRFFHTQIHDFWY